MHSEIQEESPVFKLDSQNESEELKKEMDQVSSD